MDDFLIGETLTEVGLKCMPVLSLMIISESGHVQVRAAALKHLIRNASHTRSCDSACSFVARHGTEGCFLKYTLAGAAKHLPKKTGETFLRMMMEGPLSDTTRTIAEETLRYLNGERD